jgi:hypothetical protein
MAHRNNGIRDDDIATVTGMCCFKYFLKQESYRSEILNFPRALISFKQGNVCRPAKKNEGYK